MAAAAPGGRAGPDVGEALRSAGIAAAVALCLAAPMMGLVTVQTGGRLILDPHWGRVAWAVGIVFVGRLVLNLTLFDPARKAAILSFARTRPVAATVAAVVGAAALATFVAACFAIRLDPLSFDAAVVFRALLQLSKALAFCAVAAPFVYLLARAWHWLMRRLGRAPEKFEAGRDIPSALGVILLVVAVTLPFLPGVDRYVVDLGMLVLTYVMLGWGLNIVVGLAGLLDLGYVAFYAVGAYSYALLAQQFGLSFWICLPLAGVLAAFWGVLLGFPVLRLRGDYLAIVTLAFGEIIRLVLINWQVVTGGPNGIYGIPKPSFFGIDFVSGPDGFAATFGLKFSSIHRVIFMYYLILALALITNLVVIRLRRLPIGRAWEALREDEIACRSLGINTVTTKLTAFAIGAMFAGFAGSFFATRQGIVTPESFVFMESVLILAIVVLGGMGSQFGVAVAALAMIGGFELFREFKDYRMIVFGVVMVLVMLWRPRGLVSSRAPTVFLKERKTISAAMVQEGRG